MSNIEIQYNVPLADLVVGSTIGMLDGVVKFDGFQDHGNGNATVYVSLGRLVNHPVRYKMDSTFTVYSVPAGSLAFHGV